MGVKGLMTPYIKDYSSASNAKLKAITEKLANATIGFDMSVVIIKNLSSSPIIQSKYHQEPKIPLPELIDKVISCIDRYFQHGMEKGILVFDGKTPELKLKGAHRNRYGNDEEKKARLEELYKIRSFDNEDEEKECIKEMRKLRSSLCRIRNDILHQVVKRAKEVFGDNVVCIGSPFEADHQLAYLFHQNIIDYVVTVDSDLVCFGAECERTRVPLLRVLYNAEMGKEWLDVGTTKSS